MAAGFPGEGGNITLPLDVNVLSIQSAGHFSAGTITLPDPSKEPVGCEFEILNGNLSVGALTVKAVAGTVTGAPAALVPYVPLGFVVVSTTEWRRSR